VPKKKRTAAGKSRRNPDRGRMLTIGRIEEVQQAKVSRAGITIRRYPRGRVRLYICIVKQAFTGVYPVQFERVQKSLFQLFPKSPISHRFLAISCSSSQSPSFSTPAQTRRPTPFSLWHVPVISGHSPCGVQLCNISSFRPG
jgi:hypothetical protein